jgi:hypothetical protein
VIDEGPSRQQRCQTVVSRPQTEIEILEGEEIGVFKQATPLERATADEHEAAADCVNDPCAGLPIGGVGMSMVTTVSVPAAVNATSPLAPCTDASCPSRFSARCDRCRKWMRWTRCGR